MGQMTFGILYMNILQLSANAIKINNVLLFPEQCSMTNMTTVSHQHTLRMEQSLRYSMDQDQ